MEKAINSKLYILDDDDDFVLCGSPKNKSPKQARGVKRKRQKVVKPKTVVKAGKQSPGKVNTEGPLNILFQKQKQNMQMLSTEIVISDDSSDFVFPKEITRNCPKDDSSRSTQDQYVKDWLTAAKSLVQQCRSNDENTNLYNTESVSDDCTNLIQPPFQDSDLHTKQDEFDLRPPSSPELFSEDSDDHKSSVTQFETDNMELEIDPLLFLSQGSDGSQKDVTNKDTVPDCELAKNEVEKQSYMAVTREKCSAKVSDGVKRQATITSFFGGKTSKPVKAFVNENTSKKPLQKNDEIEVSENVTYSGTKSCPFYKKIYGTKFAVDAFNYGSIPGVDYYFLTHFHADHYQGLNKKFKHTIYCTQVTANLVALKLGIPKKQLNILTFNTSTTVDGVDVTLVDANHCPGSVMFIFHFPKSGNRILHTGDFRFNPTMMLNPSLQYKFHTLHLDTTYLNPLYNFPDQDNVVDFVRDVVRREAWSRDRVLVVCGSYTIGKEKVFMAAAQVLDCCVWAGNDKQKVLCCLEDQELKDRLTPRPQQARVHVLPMQRLTFPQLRNHLASHQSHFDKVLAFKPTGWTHSQGRSVTDIKPVMQGNVHLYNVPYSEHSSFGELEQFIKFLVPGKVIPTVNVGCPASRNSMNGYIQAWLKNPTNR